MNLLANILLFTLFLYYISFIILLLKATRYLNESPTKPPAYTSIFLPSINTAVQFAGLSSITGVTFELLKPYYMKLFFVNKDFEGLKLIADVLI